MNEHFETRAIHAGQPPDPATGAVTVPIYQTSTFAQEAVGRHHGYEYARTGNPTRAALEACLASLEEGEHGLAFASGMAATDTVLRLLSPGDHLLVGNDVYGGTYRLLKRVWEPFGLAFTVVDMADLDAAAAAIRPETRMIWLETPTNPLLGVADIAALAQLAQSGSPHPSAPLPSGERRRTAAPTANSQPASSILLVVDNTFATPYAQRPLALGADIVVHSTTKYLGGHSDVVGGAAVMRDAGIAERLAFLQNAAGAVPGPLDSWLVLRGIKTLALRMAAHSANALAVARYLAGHPAVSRVYYPGLPSHPQHALACRQMAVFGGMVSFELKGGEPAARRVVESTRIFTLAESLGGVESLIELPAAMTHASVAGSPLEVPAGLVRLSVGIEHVDDLIGDLQGALGRQ